MAAHISLTRPAMPRLRPYAPRDWAQFTALELETQLDSLGDSTEEERAIFRERFPALLDVKMGFSRNGFRRPGAQLWVLEGDDGRYLEIGRASCRERVEISVGAVSLEEKNRSGRDV